MSSFEVHKWTHAYSRIEESGIVQYDMISMCYIVWHKRGKMFFIIHHSLTHSIVHHVYKLHALDFEILIRVHTCKGKS